jgi:hypothetical protein
MIWRKSMTTDMKKPKSKKEMIDYLKNHERYSTMNSWNGLSSYSRCVKLYELPFQNREVEDIAFELLDYPGTLPEVRFIMDRFARKYDYSWQICQNGRSGGYLVLYQGGKKQLDYRSYCRECGQRNYRPAPGKCGVCGAERVNYKEPPMEIYTSGQGTDQGADFEDWDIDSLRDRVSLIWDFDLTVDWIIKTFIAYCRKRAEERNTAQAAA